MSFDVQPPGPGGVGPVYDSYTRLSAGAPQSGRFARVYELEEARRRQDAGIPELVNDRIPDDVWDEVDAAARLVERLQAQGRQLVFDTDRLSGSVVASLLEPDGTTTPVSLTDVVDPRAADRATRPES